MAQSYYALSHTFNVGSGGGTRALDITSSGSVGIGTTSPQAILHSVGSGIVNIVQSSNDVSYTQYYNTSTGTSTTNDGLTVGVNGTAAYIYQREADALIFGTSNTERIRITSTGNVGIGTTAPQDKLTVKGPSDYNLNLGTLGGYSGIYVYNDASSAYKELRIDAAPLILQSFSGANIGIGTTTPTLATLQVNGNVHATSFTGSFSGSITNAVSASYAATASYATNFIIASSLVLDQTLTDYASVAASSVGSNNLFSQNTGSYTSAFFKYTCASASNARSGEVVAVWNGASAQFYDNSTVDVGNTTAVTSSAVIVTGQVQFNMQTNTSGWAIKSIATFM
jgi:hypothetical protein